MTHEPECFGTQNIHYSTSDCPICSIIRAAYKRGRDDAANAVSEVVYESLGVASVAWSELPSGVFNSNACIAEGDKCVAAARGGEQE